MTTLGPDSLRALAEEPADEREVVEVVFPRKSILAHADTWEADQKAWSETWGKFTSRIVALEADNAALRERVEKYAQLIYAVETKHEGESRYETALRYIREAEYKGDDVAALASTPPVTQVGSCAELRDTITDGYSVWSAVCPKCGGRMQVVRPGKVQCSECG